MKKIILILPLIILLTGCISDGKNVDGEDSCYRSYCDEKYGIEYIERNCTYQGGITVRLDENGDVIHCSETSDEK